MKKLLLKKLTAFIVTTMMISVSANAQIVYTDVNPDSTLTCSISNCSKSYNLDLNNDGIIDFLINTGWRRLNCSMLSVSTVKFVSETPQIGNGAVTLMINANDIIDSNLAFSASNGTLLSITTGPVCSGSSGNWTSTSDHYLGLKLTVGANIYYGWVRLNVVVASSASFTVQDYAYNTIPNQPILAGQTIATGINENSFASSINLFPNPATNNLTIKLGNNNKNVEVTIIDITGKTIYSTTASDSDNYQEQNVEINTEDFAAGVYVVQIQTADFIGTKKLVIKK